MRNKTQEYYYKNRERILEKRRLYRKENLEKVRANQRRHYAKHKERILEEARLYRKLYPKKAQMYQQNYYYKNREKILIRAKYRREQGKIPYRKRDAKKLQAYQKRYQKRKKTQYNQLHRDRKYVDVFIEQIKISEEELIEDYKW
jgi:hypothetical protein